MSMLAYLYECMHMHHTPMSTSETPTRTLYLETSTKTIFIHGLHSTTYRGGAHTASTI